jgi:hypothetical protein
MCNLCREESHAYNMHLLKLPRLRGRMRTTTQADRIVGSQNYRSYRDLEASSIQGIMGILRVIAHRRIGMHRFYVV